MRTSMHAGVASPGAIFRSRETKAKPINRATVARVLHLFRGYTRQAVLIAICVLISAALGVIAPFFLKTIVNQGIIARNLDVVTRYSVYTLVARIAGTGFALGYGYLSIY